MVLGVNACFVSISSEGMGSNPWLVSFFYQVTILTNSLMNNEKRRERRGILQKRTFKSRGCGDDRDSTTRSKREYGRAEEEHGDGEKNLNKCVFINEAG